MAAANRRRSFPSRWKLLDKHSRLPLSGHQNNTSYSIPMASERTRTGSPLALELLNGESEDITGDQWQDTYQQNLKLWRLHVLKICTAMMWWALCFSFAFKKLRVLIVEEERASQTTRFTPCYELSVASTQHFPGVIIFGTFFLLVP